MFEFEPRNLRRIGIIGGAGVALASGVAFLVTANETHRIQDAQKEAAIVGVEKVEADQISKDLTASLTTSVVAGVIFLGSSALVGAEAVSIYNNRRRPESA